MMKLICISGEDARNLRLRLRLNQSHFWGRIGVTQSGGSRYESGRAMPDQVAMLLHIAYGTEKQANNILEWLRRPKQC